MAAWRCALWAEPQADTNLGAVGWLACGGCSASCLVWATCWSDRGGRSSRVYTEGWTRLCCPLQVAYFQSALDKLNEAIKLAKVMMGRAWPGQGGPRAGRGCTELRSSPQGQPDTVQDALRFAMDVIGGK